MSNNFQWGGDTSNDDESFADRPVEMGDDGKWQDVQTVAPPANPRPQAPQRPVAPPPQASVETENMRIEEDEVEEDYTSVLSDAKLRLAQGSLYEMLMNSNLFQDMDVDPKAIKNVEREVKNFARERMEIMLGMRQEQVAQDSSVISSPFNDLEVQALKALASAATKGATQAPEAQTFNTAPVVKKGSLTPISGPKRPTQKPAVTVDSKKPLPAGPATPVTRARSNVNVDQILREEQVTKAELEAQFSDGYKPIEKPLDQLTEQEILERNKAAAKRLAGKQSVKSNSALPMPSQEQINSIAESRAQAATAHPQMQSLMGLLTKK